MKIIFDSNVWQIVVIPGDFIDESSLAEFKKIIFFTFITTLKLNLYNLQIKADTKQLSEFINNFISLI